jgi:hypothetical protein
MMMPPEGMVLLRRRWLPARCDHRTWNGLKKEFGESALCLFCRASNPKKPEDGEPDEKKAEKHVPEGIDPEHFRRGHAQSLKHRNE